ncbi:unnamed protein product [Thlaspi arvense]|uniref:Uncharacterized protein n=1 Tax=Thlaspi arvense TaxID=13288 RepID=A0AAU9SBQ7_THLAR|nr:unnamed protein product [Thlaspi arvense]
MIIAGSEILRSKILSLQLGWINASTYLHISLAKLLFNVGMLLQDGSVLLLLIPESRSRI